MKFRFPVVIIDEDWRSDSASGLGIRALAKALEDSDRSALIELLTKSSHWRKGFQ